MTGPTSHTPISVQPPPGGFDRAGVRAALLSSGLPKVLHRLVKAPFGHTVGTLRGLDAAVEASDLALAAGEAVHGALLEDLARTGTLAIPDPTRDQRLCIGAFTLTVWCDVLSGRLAELAPLPRVTDDLEAEGLEALLESPPRELVGRVGAMAARYLEVRARERGEKVAATQLEREAWSLTTLHAFVLQLRGALERLTHLGRLRPFGLALAQRKVSVGEIRYEGFTAHPPADPVTDLKPVRVEDIVGNRAYLEAGLRLARDVAGYDFERGCNPKKVNPVLFGLGRPGCGKTITAHAVGNYFLDYCRARDVPARFRIIRRTDWASSYQNASAARLVEIFKEEVYGFEGVCGVYWPDIDTAFASRASGQLRMEEKQNLGAVFGIFDGTLLPKDGKWFMLCDANYMQMDEATTSRIAQNPFTVRGPTTADEYVRLLRDVLLREEQRFVEASAPQWQEIGEALVAADLSGRAVESIAGNIRSIIQDFEYPEAYFHADFEQRREIVERLSKRVPAAEVRAKIDAYVRFQKEAEEREAQERFEQEVARMVEQLSAGREAAARAAARLGADRERSG